MLSFLPGMPRKITLKEDKPYIYFQEEPPKLYIQEDRSHLILNIDLHSLFLKEIYSILSSGVSVFSVIDMLLCLVS